MGVTKTDGGYAFPRPNFVDVPCRSGMTLRDWFAGHALTEAASQHDWTRPDYAGRVAAQAYAYADAMLLEREK